MCGIVGGITTRPISSILLAGLKSLEYRGYDSAGIAVLDPNTQSIKTYRVKGKVQALASLVDHQQETGCVGIAHTRWATHGAPAERNAHPHHSTDQLSIVHNGIIENHNQLRAQLTAQGYQFHSDTDSEVIAHLLHYYYQQDPIIIKALFSVCQQLVGAYAIGVLNSNDPDTIYAARHGSPLVIGCGFEENFIASDTLALLPVTQSFIYLEDGDIAMIKKDEINVYDANFKTVKRNIHETSLQASLIEKGSHRHFMIKEIRQQPEVVIDTFKTAFHLNQIQVNAFGEQATKTFPTIKRIHFIACGTSLHAANVAQHWIEEYAHIPCEIAIASEHRYRTKVVSPGTLLVCLSQSGETADTLAVLRQAKQMGYIASLGICNVPSSSLAREADMIFLTRAGIEIGVAATKTFTAQLIALACFTLAIARSQGTEIANVNEIINALEHLPTEIAQVLQQEQQIINLASALHEKHHALFLGRGVHYAIAQEGALKMKEISYIHAEAYAAGELKHGPLALIDEHMPVIVIAPNNHLMHKLLSNIKEVQARGGEMIIFSDHNFESDQQHHMTIIPMPTTHPFTSPILYNIPLQLLAYHTAILKGTDIDQPRNLAKSVTVE